MAVQTTRTHTVVESPIGPLTAVREDGVVVGLSFDLPGRPVPADRLGRRDDAGLADVATQLREYFAGDRTTFDLVVRPSGNDFLLAVLEQMTRIPYGETRSYGQLAGALGDRTLSQA